MQLEKLFCFPWNFSSSWFLHLAVTSLELYCQFLAMLAKLIEHAKGKTKTIFRFFKHRKRSFNLNLNLLRSQSKFLCFFLAIRKDFHRQKRLNCLDFYRSECLITASRSLIRRCSFKITIFSTLEHETKRYTGACCMQIARERAQNVCN